MALVVSTAVVACGPSRRKAKDDDDDFLSGGGGGFITDDGGSGGFGASGSGASGPGPSSGPGSGTTGPGPSSSGSTVASGPSGCDTHQPGNYDPLDAICQSCIQCTMLGPCTAAWAPCQPGSSQACDLLFACFDDCEVQCNGTMNTCYDACAGDASAPVGGTCIGDNPTGVQQLLNALSCSVCQECPINCNAAANCQ